MHRIILGGKDSVFPSQEDYDSDKLTVIYYKKWRTWGILDDNKIVTVVREFMEAQAVYYHLTGKLWPYLELEYPVR